MSEPMTLKQWLVVGPIIFFGSAVVGFIVAFVAGRIRR